MNKQPAKCENEMVKQDGNNNLPDYSETTLSFSGIDVKVSKALQAAIGSSDWHFSDHVIGHCVNLGSEKSKLNEKGANEILALVKGIQPTNQIEAMLALQMAAVHKATMNFAIKLKYAQSIKQQDSCEKTLNKLSRTFIAQMEALRKYRTGGQQKVTVEHVHVHEGGQAVVGNINHNSGNKEGGR